jgi:hypothetical protein
MKPAQKIGQVTKPVKEPKSTIFVSFMQGKQGEREIENHEFNFTDVDKITSINQVKGMEALLSKTFINPKVINFIYLKQ